jgi:hypothetical protein
MLIAKVKEYVFFLLIVLCGAVIIMQLFLVEIAIGDSNKLSHSINGIWKLDVAMTVKSRIARGVPWHIGDRFGMGEGIKIIREFDNNIFRFYNEKTNKIVDNGTLKILESKNNEIVLRIFPEDNRYNINNYKFEELVRLSRRPGDNVPGIIGLKFLDNNTIESFSYVKDFGKDKMIKKYDNAYWKRITKFNDKRTNGANKQKEIGVTH